MLVRWKPYAICPRWLQGWRAWCEKSHYKWFDDRAPTMGAADRVLHSILACADAVMVIAVAGSPSVRKRRKVRYSANLRTSSVRRVR